MCCEYTLFYYLDNLARKRVLWPHYFFFNNISKPLDATKTKTESMRTSVNTPIKIISSKDLNMIMEDMTIRYHLSNKIANFCCLSIKKTWI